MPILRRFQCRLAPFAVLVLLGFAEFKSDHGGSCLMVEAAFIGGQGAAGVPRRAPESTLLGSKYLAPPKQEASGSSTPRITSKLAYRPLPDDLISEQAPARYESDVDALKALLDETVSVYMDSSRSAQAPGAEAGTSTNATQAQEIQNLIQEMNHALQHWETSFHGASAPSSSSSSLDKAKMEQGTRFEVSLLLEQATRRYVEAVNRGDSAVATEQHERMQDLAARFKQLPRSEGDSLSAAEQQRRSETTSLASFQARLEQIKKHLPKGKQEETDAAVGQIAEYHNRKMQSTGKPKDDLPEIVFQEGDIPDPELLQELLYQATVLFDRCDDYSSTDHSSSSTVPITKQVQELVEDIGHVLYYAIRSYEQQEEKAALLQGTRTRVKVAQEVEAALQLHMKIGDDLSEEILRELAMEFRSMPPVATNDNAVSAAAVVGALEERINKLQQKLGVKPTRTQQPQQQTNSIATTTAEEKEVVNCNEGSVPKWDCWSDLSAEERRNQLEDISVLESDGADSPNGLQTLLDRSTVLLAKSNLSEPVLENIQSLVEDIAQALYSESKDKALNNMGSSSLLSLQGRLERLEQEIQTAPFSIADKAKEVPPSSAKNRESQVVTAKDVEPLPPSMPKETTTSMVDNSTLIGSIPVSKRSSPSAKQSESLITDTTKMSSDAADVAGLHKNEASREALEDVTKKVSPNQNKPTTTPKQLTGKKSPGPHETTKAFEVEAIPNQETQPSKTHSNDAEKSKASATTTGQEPEDVVDQASLESWLDTTGSKTSPSKPSVKSSPPSPYSTQDTTKLKQSAVQDNLATRPKTVPRPVLSDAEWNDSVRSELAKLYANDPHTTEEKTPWQASIESDLRTLHGSSPSPLLEGVTPLKKEENNKEDNVPASPRTTSKPVVSVKTQSAELHTSDPDSTTDEQASIESEMRTLHASDHTPLSEGVKPMEDEENINEDVLEALSEAESALEYADVANVSIAERINERMGGIVSKTTDTVLDVTLRGAFFFASKALDAAASAASPTKSKASSEQDSPSGLFDIFQPKKKVKPRDHPEPQAKKDKDDLTVPFFATVKKPKKSRNALFSPHPPEVPPPVKSNRDEDGSSPHTNTTFGGGNSKASELKVASPEDKEIGAFESRHGPSPLKGFTNLFGPKSALFPPNKSNKKNSDDEDHPPRDALLPSTTLFYHSHSVPRLSRRGLLSQALVANSNVATSKQRQLPLSTIISAFVYPFLLQQVKPSLLLGAVIAQCLWMLRMKAPA